MPTIRSMCCEFTVDLLPSVEGYCYVCQTVHEHAHLDLRALRETLLVQVGERHPLNWGELCKDTKKMADIHEGSFCQTLLTELQALCPHGEPVFYQDQPLRVDTCYKKTSRTAGLDFTTDICMRTPAERSRSAEFSELQRVADDAASTFKVGQILRYDPESTTFATQQ